MFLTIGLLSVLLANSMNYTNTMDSLASINFTNPMTTFSSMNFTNPMTYARSWMTSVDMDPYQKTFQHYTNSFQYDPSAMILLAYALSFFTIALTISCLSNRNTTQKTYRRNYTYETESEYEDEDEYENEDEDDMDYTFNIYVRNRKVKWTPHPMIRRSMDSSHKNQ